MKSKADIIIVGAGICGLYAARLLSGKGKKVIVAEARAVSGGRIRNSSNGFSIPVALGPEFIHGQLPISRSLLKEAGIRFHMHEGLFYRSENGKIAVTEEMTEGWDRVMKKLNGLEKDMTLNDFLSAYFNTESDIQLCREITQLAEGFDAADAGRISVFALRDEWNSDSIRESYIVEGGYSLLSDYLERECKKNDCMFYFGAAVNEISWQRGKALVSFTDGRLCEAPQVIVTVSLGVLCSSGNESCHIRFRPPLPAKLDVAKQIGFGPVIKINMEFRSCFWNDKKFCGQAAQIDNFGFMSSDSEIPVWWTQSPDKPFLTGWVGGSRAARLQELSDTALYEKALRSLAAAMQATERLLRETIIACHVSNWGRDPYTRGAYSYATPETEAAKEVLSRPEEETLFFAGEALGHMGTVESALESAEATVKKIV